MQKAILDSFPKAEISVSIVWIQMLPSDHLAAAEKIAATMSDPRVRHYYDPRATLRAGHAFAKGVLNEGAGPAWDVYLFYDRSSEWQEQPPRPVDWMHQLGGTDRADPQRRHTGENLVAQLSRF